MKDEKKVTGSEDGIELTDEELSQVTGGKEDIHIDNNQENNGKATMTLTIGRAEPSK